MNWGVFGIFLWGLSATWAFAPGPTISGTTWKAPGARGSSYRAGKPLLLPPNSMMPPKGNRLWFKDHGMADAKAPMGVMIAQIIKLSEDVAVVVTEVIGLKEDVAELKKETKELSKTVDRNSFVLGVGIVLVMIGKDNLSDWFTFLSQMFIK